MKEGVYVLLILILLGSLFYFIKLRGPETSFGGNSEKALPEVVDYNFHIKPILSDKCYTCHGPDANKREAGLRLDIADKALAELPENPGHYAIVPNKPQQSVVYQRITSDDPATIMPPSESQLSLDAYEKALIKKWIGQGGTFQKHWAFIPPQKTEPHIKKDTDWGINEIDAFVLARMADNGVSPSPRAGTETLIRRMSLDLTGLLPQREWVEQLRKDSSQTTIASLLDLMLDTDAYGERMTQSWLDVSRYADSHGYQDDSYRTMWPWRDWVIHAFNTNLPYDKFLVWQLAGDLLPEATRKQILATGFNRNHPITQEGGVIQEEYRTYYVMDRTNTLGKGILGLTLECARCHDHKYDAITQKNYYEMFSFFNQVAEKGLQMDAVQAANNKYFADAPFITISDTDEKGVLSFINKQDDAPINVMVMNDSAPKATYVLGRGEYDNPTDSVGFNVPEIIMPFSEQYPKNRLGLAKWVTDRKNPLTARVFVNRVWGMLFGKGLVETVEDFGVQGSLPTHPQLLDWLAVDFMDHEWDIKYLMKKIMSSATYQQSSESTEDLKKLDPENIWLARGPRFRMSGEMIRDYILASSGLLNREIGGPSVKPYQPPGLWEETNAGGDRGTLTEYVPDTGDKLYRRSLYTFWKRTLPPASMAIFDAPTRDFCEVRRQKTNTPLQALALQNDVQMLEAARVAAQEVISSGSTDERQMVSKLFERILIRSPKQDELKILEEYYEESLRKFIGDADSAEKLLALGEAERSESDPEKTAALMLTAQVLYNLDETITKE